VIVEYLEVEEVVLEGGADDRLLAECLTELEG
jgi:hypothetical protein